LRLFGFRSPKGQDSEDFISERDADLFPFYCFKTEEVWEVNEGVAHGSCQTCEQFILKQREVPLTGIAEGSSSSGSSSSSDSEPPQGED
jgi:hypothetical protein